jgi:fructose-bisphosphate aldolase class I
MSARELIDTARTLVAGSKGLLAMDESNSTCDKRFRAAGIPPTHEARCAYRELLATTPRLDECISGAILYDETIRQEGKDGTSFVVVEFLNRGSRRQARQAVMASITRFVSLGSLT